MIVKWLSDQLDRFIDWMAPLPESSQWADELADWEEGLDGWDAGDVPPWHRRDFGQYTDTTSWEPLPEHLRQFMSDNERDMNDELWAAMQRHPVGKLRPNQTADDYVRDNRALFAVPNQPAGAVADAIPPSHAASATGTGGFPTTDAEFALTQTIVAVLRTCDVAFPYNTAAIVTRELLHHYDVRNK